MAVAAAMYAGFNAGLMAAMSRGADGLDPSALASAWASTLAQHSTESVDVKQIPQQMRPPPTPARSSWRDGAPARKTYAASRIGQNPPTSHLESKIKSVTPRDYLGSNASDISTTISSASTSRRDTRTPSPEVVPRSACHLIWCDQRAFKESSAPWKQQLEARAMLPVKAHKTAEKCIRLLRKKQHSQTRPPCVFLVSWANAPTLLPYINESSHVIAKVILLCDTDMCRGRGRDAAENLASMYPFVINLAGSWSEAVEAATAATLELQTLCLSDHKAFNPL